MNNTVKEQTLKRYTDLGIPAHKLHYSELPYPAWDVQENKLCNESSTKGYHTYTYVDSEGDNLTHTMLYYVGIPTPLRVYSEITKDTLDELHKAENIIVTHFTSNPNYFRFAIAPTKEKLPKNLTYVQLK